MMIIKRFIAGLLMVMMFVIAGCSAAPATKNNIGTTLSIDEKFKMIASDTGVYAEQYVPEDVVVMGVLDLQDENQRNTFNKLRGNFLDDEKWDGFLADLMGKIDAKGLEPEFTFSKDVGPVFFGESPRILIAMDKGMLDGYMELSVAKTYDVTPFAEKSFSDQDADDLSKSTPLSDSDDDVLRKANESGSIDYSKFNGGLYIVFKITDVAKYDELIARDEGTEIVTVDGFDVIYEPINKTYYARNQDMLILSNSAENVKNAIDRGKSGANSVKDNTYFRAAFEHMPYPHVGYFYIDMELYINSILDSYEDTYQDSVVEALRSFYSTIGMTGFSSGAILLEDDGIRFTGYQMVDESKLKEGDKGFLLLAGDRAHLINNIPADGMFVYEEIGGIFGGIIDMAIDLGQAAIDESGAKSPVTVREGFRAITGLDWDKDIRTYMNRNFAFYMSNSGSLVPNAGIMIDVSDDVDAANRTIKVFDSTISLALSSLKTRMTDSQAELIVKDTVSMQGKDVNRISMDFSGLSDYDKSLMGLSGPLANEKIEFYYGVTGDNAMLIALHKDLSKSYGRDATSLARSPNYTEAMSHIGSDFDSAVVYFEPNVFFDYLDLIFAGMELEGIDPLDSEEREIYELVKEYMAPVKYMVSGSKASRTVNEAESFIKIQR